MQIVVFFPHFRISTHSSLFAIGPTRKLRCCPKFLSIISFRPRRCYIQSPPSNIAKKIKARRQTTALNLIASLMYPQNPCKDEGNFSRILSQLPNLPADVDKARGFRKPASLLLFYSSVACFLSLATLASERIGCTHELIHTLRHRRPLSIAPEQPADLSCRTLRGTQLEPYPRYFALLRTPSPLCT